MSDLRIKSFEEYKVQYQKSIENPSLFWGEIAKSFTWKKPWTQTLKWDFEEPKIEWFKGGLMNITENVLDRHLAERGDKNAIIWEPNDVSEENQVFTYRQLHAKVCQFANALKNHGVKKGDRICLYMPMVPELTIAVLACARIGAIHSVIFAGFSANALRDRVVDAQAKMVITSDGLFRGEKTLDLKSIVDEALDGVSFVETVIMFERTKEKVQLLKGRDLTWEESIKGCSEECNAEIMGAEDPLFILYTSGSTGKPKGVVHTCGGYMVYTSYSFQNVFQYRENDIYWCTADVGWITGHSYIIYGPLLSGATTIMFEGVPTYPTVTRFWEIIEKYKVNQFLTAPTAIRALMACDEGKVDGFKMESLKVIGTVGEPINEEAWQWYFDKVGKKKAALVDNWWQTETGGIMISGLGDLSPMKPMHAGYPLPGIQPVLLNGYGEEILENEQEGYLCIKHPWPSILRTTYGDHERCRTTYFAPFKDHYFTGDGAKRDKDGMYRIIGRIDDVINVSGHRFGTAEIEDAINTSDKVIESAVVGYPHPIKGQSIYAFVICSDKTNDKQHIIDTVSKEIGRIAIPEKIQFVSGLPKTRSGKIMRRILRKIAEGEMDSLGDISTLLNPEVVEEIVKFRID
ncbi:MAG: acetyl-CoA synthetase [Lentimonas sp.]|jgi:acetyl-CoA synthetase